MQRCEVGVMDYKEEVHDCDCPCRRWAIRTVKKVQDDNELLIAAKKRDIEEYVKLQEEIDSLRRLIASNGGV
jgi:hypothetical protein